MNQRILKLSLLFVLGIGGFRSYSEGIIGSYKSKQYGFITQNYLSFFKNTTYVLSSYLKINPDSTYYLVTCGNMEEGKWEVRKDSLLLFCEHTSWRMDSLNQPGTEGRFPECGDKPGVFIIDENILKQELNYQGRTILNYFEKNK